jgi:hypothetical protein
MPTMPAAVSSLKRTSLPTRFACVTKTLIFEIVEKAMTSGFYFGKSANGLWVKS